MSATGNVAGSTSGGLREVMSCDVCSEVYEQTLKPPLVLPCGHTFCRACLLTLKKTGSFLCPNCRASHDNVQVETLTVNFSLLNVLPFCTNDFMYDKCNRHGDDLRYWCCTCNVPLCSLCLYSGHPQGHNMKLAQTIVKEKGIELTGKINILLACIEDQRRELKGCFNKLDAHMKKLFHKNAYLEDKSSALTTLLHETHNLSDIASLMYYENVVKHFKYMEEDTASGYSKSIEETGKASQGAEAQEVEGVIKCLEKPCQEQQQSSDQTSQNEETTWPQYAVMDFREGHLLLHSVAKPASSEFSFQVPSEVFLELSVGEKRLGLVFISLWCHMRRAQQMLALCMGTTGQSLQNTKASDKIRSILTFRHVGDDKPIFGSLEWKGEFAKPDTAGYVAATYYNDYTGFGICTESADDAILQAPFGRVIGGLEVVKAAFQHNPVSEVTITDSGLVLPGIDIPTK